MRPLIWSSLRLCSAQDWLSVLRCLQVLHLCPTLVSLPVSRNVRPSFNASSSRAWQKDSSLLIGLVGLHFASAERCTGRISLTSGVVGSGVLTGSVALLLTGESDTIKVKKYVRFVLGDATTFSGSERSFDLLLRKQIDWFEIWKFWVASGS